MMDRAKLAGVLADRMDSAALGPTPETEISCWNSRSSSAVEKPYSSIASSRTLRCVKSFPLSPFFNADRV